MHHEKLRPPFDKILIFDPEVASGYKHFEMTALGCFDKIPSRSMSNMC